MERLHTSRMTNKQIIKQQDIARTARYNTRRLRHTTETERKTWDREKEKEMRKRERTDGKYSFDECSFYWCSQNQAWSSQYGLTPGESKKYITQERCHKEQMSHRKAWHKTDIPQTDYTQERHQVHTRKIFSKTDVTREGYHCNRWHKERDHTARHQHWIYVTQERCEGQSHITHQGIANHQGCRTPKMSSTELSDREGHHARLQQHSEMSPLYERCPQERLHTSRMTNNQDIKQQDIERTEEDCHTTETENRRCYREISFWFLYYSN